LQYSNTENNFKFSKGNKIRVLTREWDGLKGREGFVVKSKTKKGDNYYYIELSSYPNKYLQIPNVIPHWFCEEELDFVDKDDERDYKLNQLLND
jgi:hypothetical protein